MPEYNAMEFAVKVLTEFVGTLFLVFTIATAAGQGAMLAAVSIGFTLTCMVYAGGHVSGAHYNPAVTLAVALRGKAGGALNIVGYVVAQFAGAAVGAALASAFGIDGGIGFPSVGARYTTPQAFLCEIVLTMALTNTVLNVATSTKTAGNGFYGLAIGFTVLSGAISVGGISGGCFNPAVAMLCVFRGEWSNLALYIFGPLIGGALGAMLFRLTADDELKHPDAPPTVPELVRMLLVEFWGTFMLCFTVALAASPYNGSGLAALSIGLILMAQVYTGGATSGANYNPAVSCALLVRFQTAGTGPACAKIREKFSPLKAVSYILIQSIAALLAGWLASWIAGGRPGDDNAGGAPFPGAGYGTGQAFLSELMGTFMLAYVVLHSATASANAGNGFFGVAIGFTVSAMAVALGGISGGGFNPAVGLLGVYRDDAIDFGKLLVLYWVACPIAGMLAGLMFRAQVYSDFASAEPKARNGHAHMKHSEDDPDGSHHAYFAENKHVTKRGAKPRVDDAPIEVVVPNDAEQKNGQAAHDEALEEARAAADPLVIFLAENGLRKFAEPLAQEQAVTNLADLCEFTDDELVTAASELKMGIGQRKKLLSSVKQLRGSDAPAEAAKTTTALAVPSFEPDLNEIEMHVNEAGKAEA